MRYCNYCRQCLADETMICPACGTAVQSFQPPSATDFFQSPLSSHSALDVLKSAGSSKLFLAAAIIVSVSVLLSIISSFSLGSTLDLSGLAGAEQYFDMRALTNISDQLARAMQAYSWFSWLPIAAICAGLWMFYAACKNSQESSVKTTGLTVILVSTLGSIVVSLAAMGIVVLGFIVPLINAINDPHLSSVMMSTVMIIIIIAFVIAAIPLTFYYVFIIKTIRTVRQTAKTDQPSDRVSTFVAVWNFITASTQFFLLLGSGNGIIALSSICNMAFLILMGVAILNYKASMRRLIYSTPWNR